METVAKPSTVYQDGTRKLDEILQVGKDLRRRVQEETVEERQVHQRNTGGLRVAPLVEALRESVTLIEARRLANEWRDRPEGEKAYDEGAGEITSDLLYGIDALGGLYHSYRRSSLRALNEYRDFGDGVVPGVPFESGSRGEAKDALVGAADIFPADWLHLSMAAGPLKVTVGERGLYCSWAREGYSDSEPLQPLARARIRLTRDEIVSNAVHEWAHRMQDVVPGLAAMEDEFYRRRTAGSEPYWLPGYRHDDLFREGGFFVEYAGRDPHLDSELPSPGYELLPSGLEALFGDDLEYFERFILHDDGEHEAFVLGALVTL